MKYSTVAVVCIVLAGILVIIHFSSAKTNTAFISRKLEPEKAQNIIHPIPLKDNNFGVIQIQKEQKKNIQKNDEYNLSSAVNSDVEEFAKKLRTTYVPGVYCQQVADDGTYRHQKHYFYNQVKEQFIEIPEVYYIENTDKLGNLKPEYEKYGSKTDEISYKGKIIKIWTMR
jgi:hypothetical protein